MDDWTTASHTASQHHHGNLRHKNEPSKHVAGIRYSTVSVVYICSDLTAQILTCFPAFSIVLLSIRSSVTTGSPCLIDHLVLLSPVSLHAPYTVPLCGGLLWWQESNLTASKRRRSSDANQCKKNFNCRGDGEMLKEMELENTHFSEEVRWAQPTCKA